MASPTTMAEAVQPHVHCYAGPLPDRRVRVPYSIPGQNVNLSQPSAKPKLMSQPALSLKALSAACFVSCRALHPLSSLKSPSRPVQYASDTRGAFNKNNDRQCENKRTVLPRPLLGCLGLCLGFRRLCHMLLEGGSALTLKRRLAEHRAHKSHRCSQRLRLLAAQGRLEARRQGRGRETLQSTRSLRVWLGVRLSGLLSESVLESFGGA